MARGPGAGVRPAAAAGAARSTSRGPGCRSYTATREELLERAGDVLGLGRRRLARRADRRALPARGRAARARGPRGAPHDRQAAAAPVTYQAARSRALFGCMTTSHPQSGHPERLVRSRDMSEVAELVRAAAEGDQAAWNGLVDRYNGLVWSVARSHRLATADASDVVQTTWLRLVEHLGRLQDPERVGAWLATTARRECLRTLRHSARQVPTEELPEEGDGRAAGRRVAGRRSAIARCGRPSAGSPSAARRCCGSWSPIRRRATTRSAAALDMPIGSIGPTRSAVPGAPARAGRG